MGKEEKLVADTNQESIEGVITDYVGYEIGRALLSVAAMSLVSVIITGILYDKISNPIIMFVLEAILVFFPGYKGVQLIKKSTKKNKQQ